ncbi:hypothetical protein K7432_008365 [Basidiobolus ranarum]|uniref:Uncharacterized protein n=1 Tax=Basidiobolus ranarum TaxID=34480 RepID=A0ABR2WRX7_9FUNG
MRLLTCVTLVIVIGSSFAHPNPDPNIFGDAFGYLKKGVSTVGSGVGRTLQGVSGGLGRTLNGVVGTGLGRTLKGVVGGGLGRTLQGVVGGLSDVTSLLGSNLGILTKTLGLQTSAITNLLDAPSCTLCLGALSSDCISLAANFKEAGFTKIVKCACSPNVLSVYNRCMRCPLVKKVVKNVPIVPKSAEDFKKVCDLIE